MMSVKTDEECTINAWAEQTRELLEEFIAMVRRNPRGEYPVSALPGEWDEWFLIWEGDE
jgi:hypothetical protein